MPEKKKQYVSVLFYIFLFLNSGVGHLHYWINYYLIKKSTNAFSKDMLHSVVYICVEEDSYCSSIMIPNKPQSFTRTIWRSKRTKESWLSCTFLRSHLTSDPLNIYEATWNVRKPSIPLQRKKYFINCQAGFCTLPYVLHKLLRVYDLDCIESLKEGPSEYKCIVKFDDIFIFPFCVSYLRFVLTKKYIYFM